METKFAVTDSNLVVTYEQTKIFALLPQLYPQLYPIISILLTFLYVITFGF